MKILLYFFARYLLAPLFVAVMIFVLTGIKTIKSKLSLKKLIIFILLASIAVALPSLFGFLTYIIHSGFISGYQNRYGDNLKPPTNVYHRMTA